MAKVFEKINFSSTPEQTIKYIQDKKLELSFDYYDLQKEAHHKAFTVAKVTRLDLLADIQSSLVTALKEGQSFDKWKKELAPTLIKKGWYGKQEVINPLTGEVKEVNIGSRRLRTIFQTNTRAAHAQGRAANIYASANEYLQYKSLLEGNRRVLHKQMHNIVKHKHDPFWEKNFPPNGYGCDCYLVSLSKKDLDRRGLEVDTKDYGIIADKEFAHDTRNLSQVALQNSYYNKVQEALKGCVESNARKVPCPFSNVVNETYKKDIASTLPSKEEFGKFIDNALDKNIKQHKTSIAGYLTLVPGVIDFLSTKNITPKSDAIVANTGNIRNLKAKQNSSKEGKVLTNEEIKALPEKFKYPDAVYYDGDLLIVFDSLIDDKVNKVVIKIDFQSKKEIYNNIHSGMWRSTFRFRTRADIARAGPPSGSASQPASTGIC